MFRGALSYALLVVCVFLLLVGITLSDQRAADAQSSAVAPPPLALAQQGMQGGPVDEPPQDRPSEAGGSLTVRDWLNHLPVALVSALVVVAADAAVIAWIIRGRRAHQ